MCHFPASVKREATAEGGDTIAFFYDVPARGQWRRARRRHVLADRQRQAQRLRSAALSAPRADQHRRLSD
jgi:hypothetical protein